MSRSPVTIQPQATLAEARVLLDRKRIRHLPVVEEGKLVGIITDRDIRSGASASSLDRVTMSAAMARSVLTVTPETDIQEAAKLMLAHRIGGLPVLSKGELHGIITETDLVNAFVELLETATLERIALDYGS